MEKIKNLIHPGKSKDDEVMYGSGQSGDPVHTGSGSQATGSDPIASSTHPTEGSTREPVGQGATGSVQHGSAPLSSSRMPGTFEDDVGSTSSIKSGQPGNTQELKMTGVPDTRDPLDTNKALPREPAPGGAGQLGSSYAAGAGPHSSTLGNKADPRVDSDLDGSRGLGSQSTTGATSVLTGGTLPDRTVDNTEPTSGTSRSFPLGGTSSGTTTSGPHSSGLANRADPRVDSDRDGSRGLGGTSGLGSGTGASAGSAHQGDLSRSNIGGSAAPTGGQTMPRGYGEESWTHDHGKHGHEYAGDPCENEPPAPGALHFTSGPHSLDTANRLDPRVGGGSIGGAQTSHNEGSLSGTGGNVSGRDAALGAGAGATGVGGYESSRDAPSTSDTQYDRSTVGPHKSDLLNKMDPRVDSDLSKQHGSTTTPRGDTHGGERYRDHNISEDTSKSGYSNPYPPSLAGTGLASGPASSTTGPTGTTHPVTSADTTDTTGPTTTGKDHHYGRDAGLAGVGAGAVYEADKHLHGSHGNAPETRALDPTSGQQPVSGTSGLGHGKETALTGARPTDRTPVTGMYESSHHQPSSTSGLGDSPSTVYDDRTRTGQSHTGRDAALGAGAGVAAVAGSEELSRKDLERQQKAAHKEEMKEQEAIHKQELKDQKHHQHEQEKAEKAHDKALAKDQKHHQHEQEKAEKAHEKALAKEEKHHQHEKEKAEKEHEKKLAKEEAKHQPKEEPQEGEKKHHGLLGFLHRDKPDKELKEDELARKERLEAESHPGAGTAAGAGAAGAAGATGLSEMEKHQMAKEHDRNRLHKDPPPGFGQTTYAEPPKQGYASQVTGGTGTTALAQGEPVARGSHLTGVGNKMDPSITGRGETIDSDKTRDSEGRLVEPQTGLPLDLNKGDGAGGTDSNPIPGYHAGQSSTGGTTGGVTGGTADQGEGFGHFQDHPR
ncbi:MAG: hypothetical protein Q9219_005280 [cf. Caloplaca sp. 3 TL-2023]